MNFVFECDPLPAPRPRFSRGRIFMPLEYTRYKEILRRQVQAIFTGEPMKGNLICHLKFFRKFKENSRRFGDVDNLSKSILDALNGLIWADDSQIVRLTIEKYQSDVPKVEIEVKTP